jgi:hypothetical protein
MGLLSRVKRLWELSGTTDEPHPLLTTTESGGVVPLTIREFRPATVVPDDPIDLFPPELPEQENLEASKNDQ